MSKSTETSRRSNSGLRTNLVLAAALIAVFSFAYWLELRKKPNMPDGAEKSTRLTLIDETQDLESVKIIDKEKDVNVEIKCVEKCQLNNPAAKWTMATPAEFPADEANVATFITGVLSSTVQETIPLEGDVEAHLKEFGLAKAQRENRQTIIKFKKDPNPYVIAMGDTAAVGENMYVLASGPGLKSDVVRIMPAYLKTNLERKPSYWRAKRLFNFAASEVEALILKNPAGGADLAREGTTWYLMPGRQLADNEAIDTYVTGLVFMNAQDFVSDDKDHDRSKLGLGASRGHFSITVKLAKKPPVVMDIYDVVQGKVPHLYAMLADKNYIVELDRTNAEKFTKRQDSFRFRNLLTVAEKEQAGLVLVKLRKHDALEFKKQSDAWVLSPGAPIGSETASADIALNRVGAARISQFLGKGAVPKGSDELSSWVISDKTGRRIRDFVIYGSETSGDYYVKLSNGELGKLERGSGSAVPSKLVDFQKPAAPVAPPGLPHPTAPTMPKR